VKTCLPANRFVNGVLLFCGSGGVVKFFDFGVGMSGATVNKVIHTSAQLILDKFVNEAVNSNLWYNEKRPETY
jgi:hypothetical protein